MVDVDHYLDEHRQVRSQPMHAKTLDLRTNAPRWFIEDGVVARMFKEIHDYVRVLEVMEA